MGRCGRRSRASGGSPSPAATSGDLVTCLALLERALKSFEADGDQWGVAAVLVARAKHAHVRADLRGACMPMHRRVRGSSGRWVIGGVCCRRPVGSAPTRSSSATSTRRRGCIARALQMAEELGLWPEVAGALGMLGWTVDAGRATTSVARAHGERALRLATEQGQRSTQALAEIVLGFAARRTGGLWRLRRRLQAAGRCGASAGASRCSTCRWSWRSSAYVMELRGELCRSSRAAPGGLPDLRGVRVPAQACAGLWKASLPAYPTRPSLHRFSARRRVPAAQ